jgi:hypothetical protein
MAPEIDQHSRPTTAERSSEIRALPADERFHLLHTSRRRETIRYLLEVNESVRMPDLARHVAAAEYELPIEDVSSEQYERLYIPLYQSHLPKLEDAGVIVYDQPNGIVQPTERLEEFRPYLEWSPGAEPETRSPAKAAEAGSDWYLAAVAVSGLLLVAVTFGLLPIPGELLGGVIIVIFLLANAAARR